MADTDGAANIDIYDKTGDVWRTSLIDLGSTTGMKPYFLCCRWSIKSK